MPELTYWVACSVDGFIAQADGTHDGFSQNTAFYNELFTAYPETLPSHLRAVMGIEAENQRFDTVLMGRKTYEVGLKDGITNPYGHLRQYLFSRSLAQSPDKNVALISENAIARVQALKQEPGKGIWLCGGAELATTLFRHKLIDRLVLKVNPFVMGQGISLFSGVVQQTPLELLHSKPYPGGVMLLDYQVNQLTDSAGAKRDR